MLIKLMVKLWDVKEKHNMKVKDIVENVSRNVTGGIEIEIKSLKVRTVWSLNTILSKLKANLH